MKISKILQFFSFFSRIFNDLLYPLKQKDQCQKFSDYKAKHFIIEINHTKDYLNLIFFGTIVYFGMVLIYSLSNSHFSLPDFLFPIIEILIIFFFKLIIYFSGRFFNKEKKFKLILTVTTMITLLSLFEISAMHIGVNQTFPQNNFSLFWVALRQMLIFWQFASHINDVKFVVISFFLTNLYYLLRINNNNFEGSFELVKGFTMIFVLFFCFLDSYAFFERKELRNYKENSASKQAENDLKNILASLPQGVLISSFSKEILFANEKFSKIQSKITKHFKDSAAENFFEHFPITERLRKSLSNRLRTKRTTIKLHNLAQIFESLSENEDIDSTLISTLRYTKQQDSEFITKEKTYRIVINMINFLDSEAVIFIFEDLSVFSKLDVLKQNSNFKTRILSSFSHELRTPLNGTKLPLEMCLRDPATPQFIKQKYLANSLNSLLLLESFLNDVVDYSLLLSSQFMLRLAHFSLSELLHGALRLFEVQTRLKQNVLMFSLDTHSKDTVIKSDAQRLQQVVVHLLANAMKFTSNGRIELKLRSTRLENVFCVYVSDTGLGMSLEAQNKLNKILKDPREAGKNEISTTGSNLGLRMSQGIAVQLASRKFSGLRFTSESRKGSTFKFFVENYESVVSNALPASESFELESWEDNRTESDILQSTIFGKSFQFVIGNETPSYLKSPGKIIKFPTTLINEDKMSLVEINEMRSEEQRSEGVSLIEIPLENAVQQHEQYKSQFKKKNDLESFEMEIINKSPSSIKGEKEHFTFEPCKSFDLNLEKEESIPFKKLEKMAFENSKNNIENEIFCITKDDNFLFLEANSESLHIIEKRKKKKVLIADDDAFNLMSLDTVLSSFQIETIKACNGKEAFEKFCENYEDIAFILMDYQMPEMDGVEATIKIKKFAKENCIGDVVVIGCTAFSSKEDMDKCKEAGMDDILNKPLSYDKMKKKLAEIENIIN